MMCPRTPGVGIGPCGKKCQSGGCGSGKSCCFNGCGHDCKKKVKTCFEIW